MDSTRFKSLPHFFSQNDNPSSPIASQSAFPPMKPEYRYKSVYERAGFDVYKGDTTTRRKKSNTNASQPNSNKNSPLLTQTTSKFKSSQSLPYQRTANSTSSATLNSPNPNINTNQHISHSQQNSNLNTNQKERRSNNSFSSPNLSKFQAPYSPISLNSAKSNNDRIDSRLDESRFEPRAEQKFDQFNKMDKKLDSKNIKQLGVNTTRANNIYSNDSTGSNSEDSLSNSIKNKTNTNSTDLTNSSANSINDYNQLQNQHYQNQTPISMNSPYDSMSKKSIPNHLHTNEVLPSPNLESNTTHYLRELEKKSQRDSTMSMVSSILSKSESESEDSNTESKSDVEDLGLHINKLNLNSFTKPSIQIPTFSIQNDQGEKVGSRSMSISSKELELLDNEIDKQLIETQLSSTDNYNKYDSDSNSISSQESNHEISPPSGILKKFESIKPLSVKGSSENLSLDKKAVKFDDELPPRNENREVKEFPKFYQQLEESQLKLEEINSNENLNRNYPINNQHHNELNHHEPMHDHHHSVQESSHTHNNQIQNKFEHPKQTEVKYPPGEGPCRKCKNEITNKPIYSKSGELSGQWHRPCFQCYKCDIKFTKKIPCYVFDDLPYCSYHYHELNNSLCFNCNLGVEGECIENEIQQKFHLNCLNCTRCYKNITNDYYIINDEIYCEFDALNIINENHLNSNDKIEKRRTRLMFIE